MPELDAGCDFLLRQYWLAHTTRDKRLQTLDNTGNFNPAPFELLEPECQLAPFVFNSPHSGSYYPNAFVRSSLLDNHSIRQSEDFMVEALFARVVANGMPLMQANFARAYLDINREPYELDPAMFAGELPSFANTKSIRVAGGLGTIARIVAEHKEIYRDKLDVDEVLSRIEDIYYPYHDALRNLLAKTHARYGHVLLIDCHSMPSPKDGYYHNPRPDFVIGDRYGTSAAAKYVHSTSQILRSLGYQVTINKPYAGGFITEHYGRPDEGLHAIQIEINRGLYMNEKSMTPNHNFNKLCDDLEEFVDRLIMSCFAGRQGRYSLAAE